MVSSMSISWRQIFPESSLARQYSTSKYQDDWHCRDYVDSRKPNKKKKRRKARMIQHAKEQKGW